MGSHRRAKDFINMVNTEYNARPGVEWGRKYPAPIAPDALDFIDYVFCTHAHYDHADPDTLSAICRVNPKAKIFVSAAIRNKICGYGIDEDRVIGLSAGKTIPLTDDIDTILTNDYQRIANAAKKL